MAVNEVIYNGKTLIDLKNDTVTPETLAVGVTAHDASGNEIVGTMPTKMVLYTPQTLTEAEQEQARVNIGIDEEYKAQLVQMVIESLGGNPVFGYVDENNNIIVQGNLADGTYSVKYEMEDGSTVAIGNLVLDTEGIVVEIVNQIPLSTDTDGTIYNGVGYKTNTRIKGTGATETYSGASCTGFIPVSVGDVVYVKGIVANTQGYSKVHCYDANKATIGQTADVMIGYSNLKDEGNGVYSCTITNEKTAYIRVSSAHIMDGSEIVTINQPIV